MKPKRLVFGETPPVVATTEDNPMVVVYGATPGRYCWECVFLEEKGAGLPNADGVYLRHKYACMKRGGFRRDITPHKRSWPACRLFSSVPANTEKGAA